MKLHGLTDYTVSLVSHGVPVMHAHYSALPLPALAAEYRHRHT